MAFHGHSTWGTWHSGLHLRTLCFLAGGVGGKLTPHHFSAGGVGGKAALARDENTATLSKVNRLLQVVSPRLEKEREKP